MRLLIYLALLLTLSSAAAQDFIFGAPTAAYNTADSNNGGLLLSQKATLSQPGTIKSLSFYVTVAAGQLYLAVYADNAGTPGALVATTPVFTPFSNGWNTIPVASPAAMQPGTYWLSYFPSSSTLAFVKALSGTAKYCPRTFGPPPSPFCSPVTTEAVQWSLYATLSPLTAGPINGAPSSPAISTSKFGVMDFAWDTPIWPPNSPTIAGYRLYVGVGSSGCPGSTYVSVPGLTGTYTHLAWGVTQTAQVSAMGSDGHESACSNVATGQPK